MQAIQILSGITILIAFIALIRPMPALFLPTRRRALVLLVAAIVIGTLAAPDRPAATLDAENAPSGKSAIAEPATPKAQAKAPAKESALYAMTHDPEPGCRTDWHKCVNNRDFVENSGKWIYVTSACKISTENSAKYGEPKWPSWTSRGAFDSFFEGTKYIETGVVVAVEPDVQMQNNFGAMVHSKAVCTYDLNKESVVGLDVSPR